MVRDRLKAASAAPAKFRAAQERCGGLISRHWLAA